MIFAPENDYIVCNIKNSPCKQRTIRSTANMLTFNDCSLEVARVLRCLLVDLNGVVVIDVHDNILIFLIVIHIKSIKSQSLFIQTSNRILNRDDLLEGI